MKGKLPENFYNPISIVGISLTVVAFGLIVFLFILDRFSSQSNPYMGLITFVALPAVILFGFALAFFGLWRTARKVKKGLPINRSLRVDLANPKHRTAFLMFVNGGLFFVAISAFGTYKAYEYTESVQFCGKVCHNVMKPEYTAYQNSPHARVPCTGCHIGNGATWWVRSKISGAYQVYSVLFNKYDRPIPTPVKNLRPAKETCEECHWPSHFYSEKLVDHTYYLSDEANTKFNISMLVKIGGSDHGAMQGIHAHMYLDKQISYISTDRQRQVIPYVEARGKDGKVEVYQSMESPLTDDQRKTGEKRVVDCIDCHNRPSHQYKHPEFSVNMAMTNGAIDPTLPEIKMEAVEVLEKPYKTEGEALSSIQSGVQKFYKESHPDVFEKRSKDLAVAIAQIQAIYSQNYFPEMNVSWKAYPNNLDHMHSAGCFRCHDGKHVSKSGKVISRDCQTCHTILSEVDTEGKRETSLTGVEFKHPVDIGDAWKEQLCKDCHGKQEEEPAPGK